MNRATTQHTPAPGTEYPFSVSDIAHATAALLGKGWSAESGAWGVTGTLSGPYITDFTLLIDSDSDLCIDYEWGFAGDLLPERPDLPGDVKDRDGGVYLELAQSTDGLDALAARVAAAIRAITGQPASPAPGTEYSYALSDYAHAAARALGGGWMAESGFLGAWALLHCSEEPAGSKLHGYPLRLFVDTSGALCTEIHDDVHPATEWHYIPTDGLPDEAPRTPVELEEWGRTIAAAIRRNYSV